MMYEVVVVADGKEVFVRAFPGGAGDSFVDEISVALREYRRSFDNPSLLDDGVVIKIREQKLHG